MKRNNSIRLICVIITCMMISGCTNSCRGIRTPDEYAKPTIPEGQVKIRVMIVPHGRHTRIFCDAPFKVYSADKQCRSLSEDSYVIRNGAEINATSDGIKIGTLLFKGNDFRIIPQTSNPITVYESEHDLKRYFGELIIYRNEIDMTVDVVNIVGLENYLIGVLGREVAANWPIESLKAQAVASRTRVLFQRQDARKLGDRFDVRSDTKDQVYGGIPSGPYGERIKQAVKATAGQVLTLNEKIFKIYFASTCGGATEHAERVFQAPANVHTRGGIACPYCADSPVFHWKHRISNAEVARRISMFTNVPITKIIAINTAGKDRVGHAASVSVKHDKGVFEIDNAYKFRTNILGKSISTEYWQGGQWQKAAGKNDKHKEIIMSTSFEARIAGDYIEFAGTGWGHAVGLCQFGAKKMADDGQRYRAILAFYYPGSIIKTNYNNQVK